MKTLSPLALFAGLAVAACASVPAPPEAPPAIEAAAPETVAAPFESPKLGRTHEAAIISVSGARIGQARFTQGMTGVLIVIELSPRALPPGWHGLHIHERGDCSDPAAGFKLSGAHVGHGGSALHGLLAPMGPETGDLPNLFVPDADGPTGAEFFLTTVALAPEARGGLAPLLGPNGAALVIHANRDDHASQPIGGSGPRIACAALRP
jgi:Cu-Zn family superoxide dismutase